MPLSPEDYTKYKQLYLDTARMYVDKMQQNSISLLGGSQTEDKLDELHLASHSLTTQSLMMGFNKIGNFSHLVEKISKAKQDKIIEVSEQTLSLINIGIAKLQESLKEIETNNQEIDISELIQQVESVAGV
jgi:chemotaxis protein histidine kinase CheA